MKPAKLKIELEDLLASAGIRLHGDNPWDIQVHNDLFYPAALKGSLGVGEAYIEKWWDCHQLDAFFCRVFRANLETKIKKNWSFLFRIFLSKIFNHQSQSLSFKHGQKHYDLGNQLFTSMLDSRMVYTCGYWKDVDTLEEAQRQKLDLVCRKLYLQKGMHILDVGCGWGSLAKYAAEQYGVHVTGITVSPEQVELGRKLCAGLPVEIKLQDYRSVDGTYDHIVSLGMFEHVVYKNHRTFMKIMHRCLKDEGLFLLHTIGSNESYTCTDPWIDKYIFPGSLLPSVSQIGSAIDGVFVLEDLHSFGADYDKTLMAWHTNFVQHWDTLKDLYDDRFFRIWTYYLLMCAGSFRARKNQLWQMVFSKNGLAGGYTSVR